MANELRDELFKLSKAKMKKLEAESTRILNEHMLAQAKETEARIEASAALKDGLVNRLQQLDLSLNTTGEGKRQLHLFKNLIENSVDTLERSFREFTIDKARKRQELHNKASKTLSSFPTESRQQLQEEKKTLVFSKLRAIKDKGVSVRERSTADIVEAQQKVEEKRTLLVVVEKKAAQRRERLAANKKEFEEAKAMFSEKTRQEKETSEQLAGENDAKAKLMGMITSEEADRNADKEVEELEAQVDETEKQAAEASSKLVVMLKEHEDVGKANMEKKQALEERVVNEDTNLELQLTDVSGALQHAQLLHKGVRQRLEVTRRKLQQDQGGKSIEEIEKALAEREIYRKEEVEATKKALEELRERKAEMDKEDGERVSSANEVAEKIAVLSKKEAELRSELANVRKQLAKNAAECTASSKNCNQLEEEIAKLKDDKKRLHNKILAFTQMTTPAKKHNIGVDALDITLSKVSSGDSDVTGASLDVDGIDAFSPETLKLKKDIDQMSSFSYSDKSGAEETPLLNDSLLGDSSDTGDEGDDRRDGDYLDVSSDQGGADDEDREERGGGDLKNGMAEEADSLFDLSDFLGDESQRREGEEDIVSDLNSSRDDGRFPRDIFLNETPHRDMPRANSPPANLTEDDMDESVLESDVSMQSVWD